MARKQKELFRHKVLDVKEITSGYFTVYFERMFDFVPGQVVAISINKQNEPRLYSIASGNSAKHMKILFDVKPDGLLTPALSKLKPNDEILVSEPFGKFVSSNKNEWWIATGTGIAPFISMLESGLKLPKKLLHGSRVLNQFLYQDLFKDKLETNYVRFCTKEKGDGVVEGRLTSWLSKQEVLPTDIKYYLCGNPDMVVEVRDIILNKGVDFENIMAEIYF